MLLFSGRISSLIITLVSVVFFSTVIATSIPSDAHAANRVADMTVDKQAESWWRYKALEHCVNNIPSSGDWKYGSEDMSKGDWFRGGSNITARGAFMRDILPAIGDDFSIRCGTTDGVVDSSLAFWGISGLDLLCGQRNGEVDADPRDNVIQRISGEDCFASNKNFTSGTGLGPQWNNKTSIILGNLNRLVYDGNPPNNLAGALRYYYYWQTFKKACVYGASALNARPSGNADRIYEVAEWQDGSMKPVWYIGNKPRNEGVFAWPGGSTMTCGEMADAIKDPSSGIAASYASYLTANPGSEPSITPGTTDASSSCLVEGVGWIICPVITFASSIADGAFSVIEEFLQINTSLLDTNNGTYTAWSAFRNIANVAFVIVFLIIIFSQLTGMGVSNYGLKKTLPRLVIAAILVNISFLVCQLAVDITQIIGASLKDFISAIPVNPPRDGIPPPSSWQEVMGDILAGGALVGLLGAAAGGAAVAIALSISGSVLLAFLIAVLLIVVILITRQALVVILIILSPLAFVAFLLPNTETWFKKWYKMFWALLLVYPIVALLFGGGELVSKILTSIAAESEGASRLWLGIMAIGVSAIPLIMTPSLLKGALNGTGTLGAKLSGMAGKANGNVKQSALTKSRLGEAKQGLQNRFALRRANQRANSSFQRNIDQSRLGRSLGLDKGTARALSAVDKEESAEVEAGMARILHETTSTGRLNDKVKADGTPDGEIGAPHILKEAIANGDTTRARAAQRVLLNGGSAGVQKLQDILSDKSVAEGLSRHSEMTGYLRSDLNSAGLKGKNSQLAQWGYRGAADSLANPDAGLGGITLGEHADTYTKLNSVELAGQSISNLKKGEQLKHITPTAAAAVLGNSTAAGLLDGDKRELFTRIAGQAATQAIPTPGTTQPQAQTGTSAPVADTTRPPSAPAAQTGPAEAGFTQTQSGLYVPKSTESTAPKATSQTDSGIVDLSAPASTDEGFVSIDKRNGGNGRPPAGL